MNAGICPSIKTGRSPIPIFKGGILLGLADCTIQFKTHEAYGNTKTNHINHT